ncbi:Uncharacterised protein [Burkholderia oklahomensis]|nr:hypothetical protein BG90_4095 [Burkholderia oklahomensis C6786]SUY28229.1 Uncharacterised protein [Burkholderia oklahomensis]
MYRKIYIERYKVNGILWGADGGGQGYGVTNTDHLLIFAKSPSAATPMFGHPLAQWRWNPAAIPNSP